MGIAWGIYYLKLLWFFFFQTISSFIALNLTDFFYKQALYYCLLILVCYKTVNSKGLGQEVLMNKKKEDFSARFMYSMNNKVTCFNIKTSISKYMQLIPFTVSNEHTLRLFIHFHKWKSSSQVLFHRHYDHLFGLLHEIYNFTGRYCHFLCFKNLLNTRIKILLHFQAWRLLWEP